jgi:hypothetical protein
MRVDSHEKWTWQTFALDDRRDTSECPSRIREMRWPPNKEERTTMVTHVPRIAEGTCEKPTVRFVVGRRMLLGHEDLSLLSCPAPAPRFVRPTQAKGKVGSP